MYSLWCFQMNAANLTLDVNKITFVMWTETRQQVYAAYFSNHWWMVHFQIISNSNVWWSGAHPSCLLAPRIAMPVCQATFGADRNVWTTTEWTGRKFDIRFEVLLTFVVLIILHVTFCHLYKRLKQLTLHYWITCWLFSWLTDWSFSQQNFLLNQQSKTQRLLIHYHTITKKSRKSTDWSWSL